MCLFISKYPITRYKLTDCIQNTTAVCNPRQNSVSDKHQSETKFSPKKKIQEFFSDKILFQRNFFSDNFFSKENFCFVRKKISYWKKILSEKKFFL